MQVVACTKEGGVTDDQNVWARAYTAALGAFLTECWRIDDSEYALIEAHADAAVERFRKRFPAKPNRPRAESPLGPQLGCAK